MSSNRTDDASSPSFFEPLAVMVLCFAAMTLALCLLQADRRGSALIAFGIGLMVSLGLFLLDIHDPSDGFRMPWLRG